MHNMENGIYLTGMSKAELKDFLREVLTDILKEIADDSSASGTDILDVKQAAVFLRSKVTTLYEKTSAKTIPHFKRGNRIYFKRQELEAWIEKGKVKTVEDMQGEAITFAMKRKR